MINIPSKSVVLKKVGILMVQKDEQSDKILSRTQSKTQKSFYKKKWFLIVVTLVVIFGFIGIYINVNKDEATDEPKNEDSEEVIESEEEDVALEEANVVSEEENIKEPIYTYEDFKGIYVAFEGEPYNSPINSNADHIIILEDNYYQSLNRWDYDMTSTILEKTIEDNILTLKLDSDEQEQWGLHSESGVEKFELSFNGDKKILRPINSNATLYSMTTEDLQTFYSQSEIDYARIIMTLYGVPSLDSWAVWESENDAPPFVRVRHNSAGDPTDVSDQVTYPENVTHIDLTAQGMAFGMVTYSTKGDGYITRYPMPLHYHQEDQSEEGYKQLAQNAIDDAKTIYVEPFEPYEVADFIGRVEFEY